MRHWEGKSMGFAEKMPFRLKLGSSRKSLQGEDGGGVWQKEQHAHKSRTWTELYGLVQGSETDQCG